METTDWTNTSKDQWGRLTAMFPEGWEAMAKECGAFHRRGKFENPETLLRTLLIHILDGCSFRVTATWARLGELVSVSDVAILYRLRQSYEWFCHMTQEMLKNWALPELTEGLCGLRVRVVDATLVNEPGSTGSDWRYHFAIDLPEGRVGDVVLSDRHQGESFKNFRVESGMVMMGDQVYGNAPGIEYVVEQGGDVIVRMNPHNLIARTEFGDPFALREHLRRLKDGQVGDWPVFIQGERGIIKGRICAQRKPPEAAAKAEKQVLRNSQKKGHKIQPQTLEYAHYLIIFTTLPAERVAGSTILAFYRLRWQIEVVFHRLKELLKIRFVPHPNPESARAWLQGKLFGAFLVETLRHKAERFSPEGHPVPGGEPATLPVERMESAFGNCDQDHRSPSLFGNNSQRVA